MRGILYLLILMISIADVYSANLTGKLGIGTRCESDSQCISGKCVLQIDGGSICHITFCNNNICERDKGESISSCQADCFNITDPDFYQEKNVVGFIFFIGIIIASLYLLKDKKQNKKLK